jgi:hypothetical protein
MEENIPGVIERCLHPLGYEGELYSSRQFAAIACFYKSETAAPIVMEWAPGAQEFLIRSENCAAIAALKEYLRDKEIVCVDAEHGLSVYSGEYITKSLEQLVK